MRVPAINSIESQASSVFRTVLTGSRGEGALPTKQTNLLAARVRGSPVRGTRQGSVTFSP
jgi:hypothetical protein